MLREKVSIKERIKSLFRNYNKVNLAGYKIGQWTQKLENGNIEKGLYINGVKHGTWQEKDRENNLVKNEDIENGITEKYKNGKLWQIEDKKNENTKEYNSKGKLIKEINYTYFGKEVIKYNND